MRGHDEIEPEYSIEYVNAPRASSHQQRYRASVPHLEEEEVKCHDIILGLLAGFIFQICGLCCVSAQSKIALLKHPSWM